MLGNFPPTLLSKRQASRQNTLYICFIYNSQSKNIRIHIVQSENKHISQLVFVFIH